MAPVVFAMLPLITVFPEAFVPPSVKTLPAVMVSPPCSVSVPASFTRKLVLLVSVTATFDPIVRL